MTDLDELVFDWAYRHYPELLQDPQVFRALCRFCLEMIDFSILAAKRETLRNIRDAKTN